MDQASPNPTPTETATPAVSSLPVTTPAITSKKNSSWGALFAIVLILFMVTVGAFYAWGKRIAENNPNVPATQN